MQQYRNPLICALWVLVVAVPGAILGLVVVSLLNNALPQLVDSLSCTLNLDWRALGLEASARCPELINIVIGQALILAFVILARRRNRIGEARTNETVDT